MKDTKNDYFRKIAKGIKYIYIEEILLLFNTRSDGRYNCCFELNCIVFYFIILHYVIFILN
ncbi:MAG: hypothetical protein ACI8RD_001856 [Bacillariaceae sp.]|jgi:hypothetical protein